jgi:hypothetical protein
MQYKYFFISILKFKQILYGVEMVSPSSMHDDTRWFVNNQKVIRLVNDVNWQI